MRADRATLQSVSEEVLRKNQKPPRHRKSDRGAGEKVFGNHLSDAQEQLGVRRLSQFCTGGESQGVIQLRIHSVANPRPEPRSRQRIIGERTCTKSWQSQERRRAKSARLLRQQRRSPSI